MKEVYDFMEKIGTGKFSTVFKAKLKSNATKEYAIKVIEHKKLTQDEMALIV